MKAEDNPLENDNEVNTTTCYALRLAEGLEYAEFEPAQWRLTVFHVLGVSRQISLGYAELFLLEYFSTHPGQMISRQELIDHAWKDRVVSQGSLNQAVSNLRALLGDDQKREIIITVPRRGYQLNPDALLPWQDWLTRKAEILSPTASTTTPEDSPSTATPLPRQKDWLTPTLGVLAVALSISLIIGFLSRYYYSVWPPFVTEYSRSGDLHLTIVAKNKEQLEETKQILIPTVTHMESLGGGTVLINRAQNYFEFNCLRDNRSIHTLLVHIGRIQSLNSSYLSGCLK